MLRIEATRSVAREGMLDGGGEVKERVIYQLFSSLARHVKSVLGVVDVYDEDRRIHHFSIKGVLLDEWEGDALQEFMERMDEEYRTTSSAMPVSPQDRLYNLLGGPHWRGKIVDANS